MKRLFLWLSFSIVLLGCGKNITEKQCDEPCTRTSQCRIGLVCLAGVCLPSCDAGLDASTNPDGGS